VSFRLPLEGGGSQSVPIAIAYDIRKLRVDPIATDEHISHMRHHAMYILYRTCWDWAWASKNQQGKHARWTVIHILRWIYGQSDQQWCPMPYSMVLRLIESRVDLSVEEIDRRFLDRLESLRSPCRVYAAVVVW
jgi:hypothetical protein